MAEIPEFKWANGDSEATMTLHSSPDRVAVLIMRDGYEWTGIDINEQQAHAICDLLSPPSGLSERIPAIPDRQQRDRDLAEAIEALDEIMGYDKGPDEVEWMEWCNRYLPLVKRYGRQPGTLDFAV